ncbi:MAG TPA: xanthine dehydrogenase family protein molybdopterin-binding subunit [Xanthobacteraceae bacterium]|nr:xanthine dehydrogenase family protein molybdopterin-binding subunit [Xanthobacteraceae bacterium]
MAKDASDSEVEAANGYIGQALPRAGLGKLLKGRGQFVDDIKRPRMLYVAMVRSPYAHAEIKSIDVSEALSSPGVVRVMTGEDIAKICQPWIGTLATAPGMRSPPQNALAIGRARWQGEPVVAIAATTRARAEDAAERVYIEWEELPAVADEEAALAPGAPLVHSEYGNNICYEQCMAVGDAAAAFSQPAAVVEATFNTGRHTHVPLETRGILAEFNPGDGNLTVWHPGQSPHMIQWLIARHFNIPESKVRVIVPDVGGSFGLKILVFGDEMVAVAMAIETGRPVKFVADRLESFQSDTHARGHRIRARIAVAQTGEILGLDVDDVQTFGPFGCYPRAGVGEGRQVIGLIGGPYRNRNYNAHLRVAFQNKVPYGPYRAVGHPVACLVTETLIEQAARKLAIDPVELRRRNYIPDDAYPWKLNSGAEVERLSQHAALDKLLKLMNYDALRAEQAQLRKKSTFRGIGLASFIEMTNPSSTVYGEGGAPIASLDACTLRLTATGTLSCAVSITETGQGSAMMLAQIVATEVGVPIERVRVMLGDTDNMPYGGGNWGSRGTGIAGEAALLAGRTLRDNILGFAALLLQCGADTLEIRHGEVCNRADGAPRMKLEELARLAYFLPGRLPAGFTPELTVTRSYAQRSFGSIFTNGIHASHVEVDPALGTVKLLRHWVVEDCGTVINPLLVDEQIRGGVVQGLGAALFEECHYTPEGQLGNASLAEYLVPMAGEMPDIEVAHVETPTAASQLGAKGAGEAGVAGASGAVLNAVNDALAPFDAFVSEIPITPDRILRALGKIS